MDESSNFSNKNTKTAGRDEQRYRVMIEYHLKIQFFTTLPMW
jgi:hypothetical protein